MQTTFLQAFRALQRGTTPHVERAWLIAIAQNVCRTMQRSSSRRLNVETDADPELVAGAADATQPLREEITELEHALGRIPLNQRRAFVLHEWNGLRYREIADVMGLSQTAVEMLAFRARRSLSEALTTEQETKPSRLRRALDAGGILTALRALFAGGSAVHGIAGAGLAGLALMTAGAGQVPSHPASVAPVRNAPAHVATTSVSTADRPSVGDVHARVQTSAPVVHGRPAVDAGRSAVVPPPPSTTPSTQTAIASPLPASSRQPSPAVVPSPPPVSVPATPVTPPVEVPSLPQLPPLQPLPAVTVPPVSVTVPPVSVTTPAVTVPSP